MLKLGTRQQKVCVRSDTMRKQSTQKLWQSSTKDGRANKSHGDSNFSKQSTQFHYDMLNYLLDDSMSWHSDFYEIYDV